MNKQIVNRTNQRQGGYPGIDQMAAKKLAVYRSKMVAGSLVEQIPLPVRTQLNSRLALLNLGLIPATLDQLETVVSEMSLGYPSLRGYSETEALLTVRKYSTELVGSPLWAVQQACRDVSTGAVKGLDLDFPPTCPRLVNLARAAAAPFLQEAREIEGILAAPVGHVVDSQSTARINRGFADLGLRLGRFPGANEGGRRKKCGQPHE